MAANAEPLAKTTVPPKPGYKWVALSNTTLGTLMAGIDVNIVLISLPAIFVGLKVNPLAPDETTYLLWVLMGYSVITATLLVSFGRLSDIFGRVRFYNLGFLIFTVGSLLLSLIPNTGNAGAMEVIILRLVQAIGGGFLFANSAAILTDAFPPQERGMALGLNGVAFIGGSLIGLILGGFLAAINWRLVFLVNVPIGIAGTIWAYLKLKETGVLNKAQGFDPVGNTAFGAGLTILLVALTYGIMPYGHSPMGWTNPLVQGGMVAGIILLVAFVFIEMRVKDPMFRLSLFRIRMFSAGNVSGFLQVVARGGLMFMLIIWLQGIWLPLHGYNFADTPLWAGIYMAPMMGGFFLMGPLSGWLSDRFGSRGFATGGMLLTMVGFLLLAAQPANFSYVPFMLILVLLGLGMGMFNSPNMAAVMNSVPAKYRGVASGMRATIQNSGMLLSMSLFFSMIIIWPGQQAAAGAVLRPGGAGHTAGGGQPHGQSAAHRSALCRLPGLQPHAATAPACSSGQPACVHQEPDPGQGILPFIDGAGFHGQPENNFLRSRGHVPGGGRRFYDAWREVYPRVWRKPHLHRM